MNKIADLMMTLEYGPSPENDDAVRGWLASHSAGFGHFIAGRFTKPGELFDVFDPPRARRSRASRRARRPTSTPPSPPRARRCRRGRRCRATSGRVISTRWRGMCRSASGFSACSNRIDNGKPIRETRDIDVPLVARHFYHHAGWASLIESEFPGRGRSASAGRSFRGISRC